MHTMLLPKLPIVHYHGIPYITISVCNTHFIGEKVCQWAYVRGIQWSTPTPTPSNHNDIQEG